MADGEPRGVTGTSPDGPTPANGGAPTRDDALRPEGAARGRFLRAVQHVRRRPAALLALLMIPAAVLIALRLSAGPPSHEPIPREVPLSAALAAVDSHQAVKASIDTSTMNVTLQLKEGRPLEARFPAAYADTLTETLIKAKVETKTVSNAGSLDVIDLLLRLIPVMLILGLLVYLMRMQTGTSFIGKMKSDPVDVPGTRFTDVAGCDEAVRDLEEIAVLLREPQRYARTGGRMPRGYLLVGPPGTGKTLLARAVAGEAGLPFFSTSGADFSDTFVGVGKKRVRALFAKARKAAETHGGAVIFFDEIDAVGGARQTARRDSASDDRDATLIALLTEMDGFEARGNIVVLAATNRPDALDPALTRPGRFDRQVAVAAPDRVGRTKILQIHARSIALDEAVDLESLGRRTPGLVGADLEGLVNEAALEAGRRGLEVVDDACFEEALATTAMGRARTSAVVTDRDRTITAWHEGGHTVLALVEEHADDPVSVTIIPRGVSGGTTWMGGNDHAFMTREQAVARLVVALGGRAAEEIVLDGSYSQGASGDLDGATRLAIAMATEYGMTRLGLARRPPQGPELPSDVLEVVNELLADALDRARLGLTAHRDLLEATVEALLDKETLTKAELDALREAHGPSLPVPNSVPASLTGEPGVVGEPGVAVEAEPNIAAVPSLVPTQRTADTSQHTA